MLHLENYIEAYENKLKLCSKRCFQNTLLAHWSCLGTRKTSKKQINTST